MGEWERGARLCGLFFPGFFFQLRCAGHRSGLRLVWVGVRGDRKRCDRGKGGWKKQTSSVYRVGMSGVTGCGNAGNPFLGRIRGGWRTILGIPRVLNEGCERTTDGCGRCIDGGHSRIGPRFPVRFGGTHIACGTMGGRVVHCPVLDGAKEKRKPR
jgi:hypothetical protein